MNFFNQLDQPIVKKHILLISLGLVLGFLLYYYFLESHIADEDSVVNTIDLIAAGLCGVIVSYVTYVVSKKLDKSIPWKTQLASRFLSGILLHFIFAFGLITSLTYAYKKLNASNYAENAESGFIKLAIILFILMLIYSIVYFALYSYYSYAKLQIESVSYDRKQIDLQLKALKSQLSSHFLFNNLNTISSLVYKDVHIAEQYIRGLSNIYNYTLNSYHLKLVPFEEELRFVSSYAMLLETRFGSALQLDMDISDTARASKIPPLTLQMLVENAVKHNQLDGENTLTISIDSDDHFITVKNNLTRTPEHLSSFNIGLKNIGARYNLISNSNIIIEKDTHFTVKIPVLAS